jgi:hypothetical protein
VCLLALPHKEVGPTRREINRLSREWPRWVGEMKEEYFNHHISLRWSMCSSGTVRLSTRAQSREDTEGIKRHKRCLSEEGFTASTYHAVAALLGFDEQNGRALLSILQAC